MTENEKEKKTKDMKNLQELYQERNTFTKYNSAVPEELENNIMEAENQVLLQELLPIIKDSAQRKLPPYGLNGKVGIALEYDDRILARIAITRDVGKINCFEINKRLYDEEDGDDSVSNAEDAEERHRATSVGFSVYFGDGKVISKKKAKDTMIEALRYMGFERASRYNETFAGFPLVGRKQRVTEDFTKWQTYVDGWWIYTNINNDRKIRGIKGVAEMLNIPLEIIPGNEDAGIIVEKPAKQKGKRAMFSLNGGPSFCKNRSVLNTVKQFLAFMPDATFEDICQFFPRKLQGSYGVVRTLEDINNRKCRNISEDERWFIQPDEILTAADGVSFAVSTEWGDNFADFQNHVAEQLGWTLEEVE